MFISYSQKDKIWLERLLTYLRPFIPPGKLWADPYIQVGSRWEREITETLREVAVGVLLVSNHFLDSSFIEMVELPALREAEELGLLTLICVPITTVLHRRTSLAAYQWAQDPQKPLDLLSGPKRNAALARITGNVVDALNDKRDSANPKPTVDSPFAPRRERRRTQHARRLSGRRGELYGVPNLPPYYVLRQEDLGRLKDVLLNGTPLAAQGGTGALT
ncbi:MAG TPA: toll/interleukin-1 receptor domain-containing protein, partial [Longimicrobiaceae bacterium]|nr:toll/interleukin-1 receptor domain-containing protein [Longimicrobiaceae bacterium]